MHSFIDHKVPEVSVLMSCFNGDHWLNEAINSVLAQTFENFELILVDDGSTDESWSIIQSYRDRDERILAISKKNTGLADSLNVGIAQARGKWIARLDADDLCEPTRLEEQIDFVRSHPDVVLLGTGFVEIDEHGQAIKNHLYPSSNRGLLRHLTRLQRFFPHSSAFYNVSAVRKVGGYNARIHRAEDWQLWLELARLGRIACIPKFLVQIRKHSSQISLDNNGMRQLIDQIASTVCYFLRLEGYQDPSVVESEADWFEFLSWIENRIAEFGYFSARKSWVEARGEYFMTQNRLAGAFYFGTSLLKSRHVSLLVREKFFGSSFPKRLALEWMDGSNTLSSISTSHLSNRR